MFVAANRFEIADGYGDEFVERFAERSDGMEDQPGFVRFDLLAPADEDANVYVSQTYWETRADFEAWTESEAFEDAHSEHPPREWFESHPTLETYETAVTRE